MCAYRIGQDALAAEEIKIITQPRRVGWTGKIVEELEELFGFPPMYWAVSCGELKAVVLFCCGRSCCCRYTRSTHASAKRILSEYQLRLTKRASKDIVIIIAVQLRLL